MAKLNYFVGEYTVDHPAPRRVKTLFSVRPGDDETVYWGGGPSHTQRAWLNNLVILKDYSHLKDSEEVYEQFDKDFPPEPCNIYDACWPAKDFDGWLSPEGVFYRSEYMGHSSLAIDIAASFFAGQTDMYDNDAETVIRNAGWMSISHGGASITRDVRATWAQKKFLRELIALNQDFESYAGGLQRYLSMENRLFAKEVMQRAKDLIAIPDTDWPARPYFNLEMLENSR